MNGWMKRDGRPSDATRVSHPARSRGVRRAAAGAG